MATAAPLIRFLALIAATFAGALDTPVPSDPIFTLQTLDGKTTDGRIRLIDSNGSIHLATVDGKDLVFPIETVLKLNRESYFAPLAPERAVVLFPGGDRLYRAAIGGANDTTLDVQSYSLGHVSIPLESILGLVFEPPSDSQLEPLIQRLRNEPRKSEVLWLANGDRLIGNYAGMSDKAIDFESGPMTTSVNRQGIVALGFASSLVVYPEPKDRFLELTFSDGSRVGITGAHLEQGQIVANTRFNVPIKVPLGEVIRIHCRSDSIVYLTEREVADARYVSYVGPPRPFHRDSTVEDLGMRLSGQDYDRGIGTQSRTLLAYRLKPGDRRFQALVGLDDRAGSLGSVVFRVIVDGETRFASSPLSSRDAPRPIDVDVNGAKILILITEFGERGGVRDLADWAEARIIR